MANKQYILPVCSASGSGGGSSISLETNGVSNSNQSLLNLAAGTNVTLSNSAGTTTINATGAGGISMTRATITAAQLNAGTLVQVIPAPGIGKYIVPLMVLLNYKAGSNPFVPTPGVTFLNFFIGAGHPWMFMDASAFIDQTTDQLATSFTSAASFPLPPVCSNINTAGGSPIPEADADNASGQFQSTGTMSGGGNGTVDIIVWYSTIAKA